MYVNIYIYIYTRTYLDSRDLTWALLSSLVLTWTRLISLGLTWSHLDSCKLTRCHLLALLDLLGFGCQLAHIDYLSDTLGIYIYMYISIYVYLYIGGVYIYIYMYTCVMQYDRTRSKQQTLHIREGGEGKGWRIIC